SYISEFTALMEGFNQKAIYYAHAGAGELHLRPVLNLKKQEDVVLLKKITSSVAQLVKKYQGSLSGEHGDGIVRSEFIESMIGTENYAILKRIKSAFDPSNIFNPGKIVSPLPMDVSLRYETDREEPEIDTLLDFSHSQGILREAEKCNGSGDCRKLPEFGGVMCPSYRATQNEKDTTRARANALREFLTHSGKTNRFNHHELKEVFDLCLSCKACASECPSSVDVATLKAEYQYQYNKVNGTSKRDKFFAQATKYNKLASNYPRVSNFILNNGSFLIKKYYGIHQKRSLPNISIFKTYKVTQSKDNQYIKKIFLFSDELIRYNENNLIQDVIDLLSALNYSVEIVSHLDSARSLISKGFLEEAKTLATKNIQTLKDSISEETPLVGIEPSAILSFKDEYPKLVDDKETAREIAKHTFLIEEFLQKEIALGNIKNTQFTKEAKTIKFHGHCHQKALSNQLSSFEVLNLPENYKVTIIPSGCCGMAGSFGYEKEHYDVSMQIGEQTLFPVIRKASEEIVIAANGTSCRHQIKDGTGRIAKHPITILKEALI
ncbi:MAG TPA: FAD-linked oxidase C-terminal domain-containing protein, partial [Flavobacteriaceae bacterium]|nr:FAD-linked oxidase C-terminal domain-containing protein [Flavobacteriaceae bacterium]